LSVSKAAPAPTSTSGALARPDRLALCWTARGRRARGAFSIPITATWTRGSGPPDRLALKLAAGPSRAQAGRL